MKKLKTGLLKGSLNLKFGKKTISVSKKIIAAVLVVIIAAGVFFGIRAGETAPQPSL